MRRNSDDFVSWGHRFELQTNGNERWNTTWTYREVFGGIQHGFYRELIWNSVSKDALKTNGNSWIQFLRVQQRLANQKMRMWPMQPQGQEKGNYDSDRFHIRTLRYSLRRVSPLDSVNCRPHNLTLLRIPWRSLGHPKELLQIGRPAQQCTGRLLVKVGGTYVARAIRQYRTKPPECWGKA
jgi:hypothetical protein